MLVKGATGVLEDLTIADPCAEFHKYRKDEIYLQILWFLNSKMEQVVEILPREQF